MKMNRLIKLLPVMLFASLALSACIQEDLESPDGGLTEGNFTIQLTPPTKTANNGLSTEWVSGDKVNVFHAEAGTENYVNDGAFEYVGGSGFSGNLAEALKADKEYDWYVAYPYNDKMTTPKRMPIYIPAVQTQKMDGSRAHLCGSLCPLSGKANGVQNSEEPKLQMNHLVTIMKIKVTNYEEDPCNLTTVSFCHTNNEETTKTVLSGYFDVDFSGASPVYTQSEAPDHGLGIEDWNENPITKSSGAENNGFSVVNLQTAKNLGLNESATVYLACKPYEIGNATRLCIGMNTPDAGIGQSIYGKNVTCKAGGIYGVKQGSRVAPPFRSDVNFYHGKKNADGTYTIDNDGWWRCELPEGFDLQGSFNFKDLFTTTNVDCCFELIKKSDQNITVHSMYDKFKACINESKNSGEWNGNEDLDVNLYFPDDDRSGVFINATAGYMVGAWPILYREPYTEAPDKPFDTTSDMYDSYQGLVMCGYQGWHGTPGDGCAHNPAEGWPHYANVSGGNPFIFEPGPLRNGIDFWPDVREYAQTYKADGFTSPDGSTPRLYSSYDESTVDLHFQWMKEYSIDGVFMQRFVSQLTDKIAIKHSDKVLESAMSASNVHARAISIMYDMVGMDANTSADVIINDAKKLIDKYNLKDRELGQRYYLYHKGKPLIGLVSVGQASAAYTIAQAQAVVDGLQELGFSIMLGVPAYWRNPGSGDCVNDSNITTLIKDVDIIMPWLVGVYDYKGEVNAGGGKFSSYWTFRMEETKTGNMVWKQGDYSQASEYGVEYCPLVFPGFSDRNIHPNNKTYKRYEGEFYWQQIYKNINKGAKMLYVAMFDEIDEGTAIYKCLSQSEVPSNVSTNEYYVAYYNNGTYKRSDSNLSGTSGVNWCEKGNELNIGFVGIEDGLGSDYYLRLTGEAAKILKGQSTLTESKPF